MNGGGEYQAYGLGAVDLDSGEPPIHDPVSPRSVSPASPCPEHTRSACAQCPYVELDTGETVWIDGHDPEPPIHDLVAADLRDRLRVGIETYGEPLTVHTAIDPLVYAYEEALDLACYLRQEIELRRRAES